MVECLLFYAFLLILYSQGSIALLQLWAVFDLSSLPLFKRPEKYSFFYKSFLISKAII